jgi:hypothetical protein
MPIFSKHTEYEAFISIEVKLGIFYKRNMCRGYKGLVKMLSGY